MIKIFLGIFLSAPMCFITPGWHDEITLGVALIGAYLVALGIIQIAEL